MILPATPFWCFMSETISIITDSADWRDHDLPVCGSAKRRDGAAGSERRPPAGIAPRRGAKHTPPPPHLARSGPEPAQRRPERAERGPVTGKSAVSAGFALPRDASRRLALRRGPEGLHSHGNWAARVLPPAVRPWPAALQPRAPARKPGSGRSRAEPRPGPGFPRARQARSGAPGPRPPHRSARWRRSAGRSGP